MKKVRTSEYDNIVFRMIAENTSYLKSPSMTFKGTSHILCLLLFREDCMMRPSVAFSEMWTPGNLTFFQPITAISASVALSYLLCSSRKSEGVTCGVGGKIQHLKARVSSPCDQKTA